MNFVNLSTLFGKQTGKVKGISRKMENYGKRQMRLWKTAVKIVANWKQQSDLVGQPNRELLDQPITALTTEQENVYNQCFSQSPLSADCYQKLHRVTA